MALDQIWKQQLTLVTYGNEFLSQNLSFNQWVNHTIFKQHQFIFRDLSTQHLLAQHFQIWLEGLKNQGVTRLSLHNSSLLLDEKNPNPNVELLPYAHFIVSHLGQAKTAWICGKELAEWYTADNDYEPPHDQKLTSRVETMWRFELHGQLIKRVESDLITPNWDDIHLYTENELFDRPLAQALNIKAMTDQIYYGYPYQTDSSQTQTSLDLPVFPKNDQAAYANETLLRMEALDQALTQKIESPVEAPDQAMSHEERLNLKHFRQKLEDLKAKFITKAANHYQTAHLTPTTIESPLETELKDSNQKRFFHHDTSQQSIADKKTGKSSVFTLILITVIICICAYYFGL